MKAGKANLSCVSRRTRSSWDSFYRNSYNENKKKADEERDGIDNNVKDEGNKQDFEGNASAEHESFVKNGVRKNSTDFIDSEDSEKSVTSDESSEPESSSDDFDEDYKVSVYKSKNMQKTAGKPAKKRARLTNEPVLIDKFVESIWKGRDLNREKPAFVTERATSQETLPLKFRFEDDEPSFPQKSDREMDIESLFRDLEMGVWESENDCPDSSKTDNGDSICTEFGESQAAQCRRGKHDVFLDEQIGIRCKYCCEVIQEIRYVLPPFYVEPTERWEKKEVESKKFIIDDIQLQDLTCGYLKCSVRSKGTVLELIPDDEKEMYPHQLEGFEFMWRNIAGDVDIKKLERLPADGGRGCIISHAPGTGKTRLTIVFIQTLMKVYPKCRPVIIAPRGMLLAWEQEFRKWKVDMPFHNMNETKLSSLEASITSDIVGETGDYKMSRKFIRFAKLYSWMKGGSILGISYQLFEKLAGERQKKSEKEQFRSILLELPGLLVMDEGHTPRNSQSLMWKALTKVTTQRRIILSGTPFQNNFSELYNTLCLVNPRFSRQIMCTRGKKNLKFWGQKQKGNIAREEWAYLTSSISKKSAADGGLKKLQSMIHPFVHVHKGCILQNTLPGLRDSLIILKPTVLQRNLLQNITRVDKFLEQVYLTSLILVHPSLVAKNPEFSDQKRRLGRLESDPKAGVKTQFVIELIQLATRLNEKVLIFSQFIDPLLHIQKLLKFNFSWKEGREVIYMDGKLHVKKRQCLINRFNEKSSSAKVMLASQRACAEGISLVGASRVVLLDVVWNPSVERQAISRAYRLGQEKIVYVYHLVTSMEMKKYARQVEKDRISEMIFTPEDDGKTPLCDAVMEDKVLDAIVRRKSLSSIVERIVPQPKDSDLVDAYSFVPL